MIPVHIKEHAKQRAESAKLSHEEVSHLLNVGYGGLLRKVTPDEMRDNLVKRGLMEQRLGGLVATEEGHMILLGTDLTHVKRL